MASCRLVVAVIVVAASPVFTQPPAGPTFEVVSIRQATDQSARRIEWTPGRFVAGNAPFGGLVNMAYGGGEPLRLDGDDPILRTSWDVEGTFDPALDPTPAQRGSLLRAMLEDRFQLVLRRESRETDVYALMLARADGQLGPGFQPSELPCESPPRAGFPFRAPPDGVRPGCGGPVINATADAMIVGGDFVLERLTRALGSLLERPVVDRTALDGKYDVVLRFAWDSAIRQLPLRPQEAPEPSDAPNIFTALREQLGLKLESTRAPLDYHVVERVSMPTSN